MLETGSLMWGLLFGSIGTGYFLYGKNQQHLVALLSGVALCGVTYIVKSPFAMIGTSAVFMVLPFVWRIE